MADQAWYFDGLLIKTGRRLLDLSVGEMISLVWSDLYTNTDAKGRRKLDLFARGRLGVDGGEIMDNDALPESLRGVEAPEGWNLDDDPFADQWSLTL